MNDDDACDEDFHDEEFHDENKEDDDRQRYRDYLSDKHVHYWSYKD